MLPSPFCRVEGEQRKRWLEKVWLLGQFSPLPEITDAIGRLTFPCYRVNRTKLLIDMWSRMLKASSSLGGAFNSPQFTALVHDPLLELSPMLGMDMRQEYYSLLKIAYELQSFIHQLHSMEHNEWYRHGLSCLAQVRYLPAYWKCVDLKISVILDYDPILETQKEIESQPT